MALFNTINFLPGIFQSQTNQRFLGATLDQLITDPVTVPINGYIGRRFSPTFKVGDNYVPESNIQRQHYQLEPSVVIKDKNKDVVFTSNYVDLLNGIANNNGLINNHQRLFTAESYSYDGKFDYDKFVNYYNYYWLPNGPDAVSVVTNKVPYNKNYTVDRNTTIGGYTFTGTGGQPNVQLTLARGGTYTFTLDQPGINFWIQSSPGITGQDPNISTINAREVFGVKNNGTSTGTITFNVPLADAQDFYSAMPIPTGGIVDAAVDFKYTDIQNQLLSEFLINFADGLDGIANDVLLQNAKFVFVGNYQDDTNWVTPTVAPGLVTTAQLNNSVIAENTIIDQTARASVWKVNLVRTIDGQDYLIQISPDLAVEPKQKVFVRSGKTYASNQFWVNNSYRFLAVPVLTATRDYLYYQDSENPDFYGQIKLVDNSTSTIDVEHDILGKVGYTSPNGVIFTNGLKIVFDQYVTPSSYAEKEYYVEGVGTSIKLVEVDQLVVPEDFAVDLDDRADYITINRASQDRNPWTRSNRWFHKDVIVATAAYNNTNTIDYGPNIPGRRPIIEFDAGLELFNFGRQAKDNVDYIFVDKSAQTLKFGSRYTILSVGTTDFTTFGAESNNVGVSFTASRNGNPSDGTGKTTTDAFNDYEGEATNIVDGTNFVDGDRIIFANDYDTTITDQIWKVVVETINNAKYFTLIKTEDSPVQANQNVLVLKDLPDHATSGKTYRFTGTEWIECQGKQELNQEPKFNLVDLNGFSFGDTSVYPDTTFNGSRLFGYARGMGAPDPVLQAFPLKYETFNNIGDIVFNNYYDTESFSYTSNLKTVSKACNSGYTVKTNGLQQETKQNNWLKTIEDTAQYQIFTKFFDGNVVTIENIEYAFVQIDITPVTQTVIPHVKVYLNNEILRPDQDYKIVPYGVYTIVVLNTLPSVGDKIDVAILSNEISDSAYYEIPLNLNFNPLNEDFKKITLGQLRTHYNKLIENTAYILTSKIPIQDYNIKSHGGTLMQHDAPLIYGMTFLNDPVVNFVDGLTLARKEYTKFKNKFLSLCSTLPNLDANDPIAGVDTILKNINAIKNISFPWYYSDMVPQGSEFSTINYIVLNVRQTNYQISSIFNDKQLSNRAVLVYVNGSQQTLGVDFTFSNISPAIIFKRTLVVGDKIMIREYASTDGNYIPETPTKLGLYPKFDPAIYIDNTYKNPISVVRGHDGSITPAFGDFRDTYLLELELRIYNNIKADYSKNRLNVYDIIPGRFRTTEYSLNEYDSIIGQNFLSWVGKNSVDYVSNTTFNANDPWTWNYSSYTDRLDGSVLQGSWRAIYRYWYETDTPHLTPWAMLGFTDKPSWWSDRYGSGPYTSGNILMWEDLEAGYIWNNGNPYIDKRFARPGLLNFIPVDTAGNLLSPTDISLTDASGSNQFSSAYSGADFAIGQQGPAETAWRRSSDYPFAVQLALALTKPAKYFATQIDTSRFFTNPATGQFSNIDNLRVTPGLLQVNGDTTTGTVKRTSGYINWIADEIKNLGMDPIEKITEYFSNLSTQLTYKVGGFTDTRMLTVTAEQTTPGLSSASVVIPDTNYNVYLNKSVPVLTAVYSAVIVEKTLGGYAVTGYDAENPFFTIIPSIANNRTTTIELNDISVEIYQDNANTIKTIPYGTEFATIQQVSDFLISYERYLELQGFTFTFFDQDLQKTRNWTLSVNELLYWAQQGWSVGTIIVLNPVGTQLRLQSVGAVVDEIANTSNRSKVLDQNFLPIKSSDFNIVRYENAISGNNFSIKTLNGAMVAFARLDLVQFEHTIIFDNVDNFGDIIYIPSEGTRQYRLKLAGYKTGAWTGALSAPGHVYNNPVINLWNSGTDYRRGDIVKHNNFYYTATQNIAASTTFDNTRWTQLSQTEIKTGLLPNFGFSAGQFNRIYDVDQPPVNETFQEYSAGLIGFRQRQYLTDLGISIPTQTKFYQGYIKEKGSLNSINALTKTTFNNVNGSIDVYEEWAFRTGLYGGINSNTYKEFILDQSVFRSNPATIRSGNTYDASGSIVVLNGNAMSRNLSGNLNSNVYTASNTLVSTTALYSNRITNNYSEDLPTAGYVNVHDVDYTIFDINDVGIEIVDNIEIGDKIWVAKDTQQQWNVFRTNATGAIATRLTYVLDSSGQLQFNVAHGLSENDIIVLKDFGDKFNGVYLVNSVVDSTNIIITISDYVSPDNALDTISALQTLIKATYLNGVGTVYKLSPARVASIAQRDALSLSSGNWIVGELVWVDDTGAGTWGVYTRTNSGWSANTVRSQQPVVDLNSISRTFLYDKDNNNILAALDHIDPAKGKILNSVSQDIDYKREDDPALYNHGTGTIHSDLYWGPSQVGRIWWNLSTVRYINYEQDTLEYRLNHWGERFPGSTIDVYQWVESTVLPSLYTTVYPSGVPVHEDDSAYSTYGYVAENGTVQLKYYFWVSNLDTINVSAGKENSIISIASAIENPLAQGIPYIEILNDSTVALYNINHLLVGKTSVIHFGTTDGITNLVHSEYALVQEGNEQSQIPVSILSRLIDSLAGVYVYTDPDTNNLVELPVPDPDLPPSQRYGIGVRPRQTMIMNRDVALKNYITMVNKYLLEYPVVDRKVLTILNTSEPAPRTGFNFTVDTRDELLYINSATMTANVSEVLVNNDVTQSGKWTIYKFTGTVNGVNQFELVRQQKYKTNLYWNYADWYDYVAYNYPTTAPDVVVADRLELGKLTLIAGQFIKVLDNGNGQFVVYRVTDDLRLELVGVQNGTIQISTDQIPGIELRQILLAMQDNIFINDLAKKYNTIFFTMIKYILTEQKNIDWAFKTSFISAKQQLRKLKKFPTYIPDNQDFYLEYINEVKPYRTVIREFIIDYVGEDLYGSDVTDFDLPAYWDANLLVYRSPSGEQDYDETIRSQGIYSQWKENHKYSVSRVIVKDPGTGYITPPEITIQPYYSKELKFIDTGAGATAEAKINSSGGVESITITNPGSGYIATPNVIINGTGIGARAQVEFKNVYDGNNQGHNLVRSVSTTVKFDRITRTNTNTFVAWETVSNGDVISGNTIIVLNRNLYQLDNNFTVSNVATGTVEFPTIRPTNPRPWIPLAANTTLNNLPVDTYISVTNGNKTDIYLTSGNVFAEQFSSIISNITLIPTVSLIGASTLTNASDRIIAFNGNVDLNNLVEGNDYPGVIVEGGNLKLIDGSATVGSPATPTDYDAIIQSAYTDTFGVDPSEIIVDGGAYVGPYSSHAPEELVPGRMYDSLNITVYDTNRLGFRIFEDMNQNPSYYRVAEANTTTLSNTLSLTDGNIYVADATRLPNPNPENAIPGVVFINGEKITYYVRDVQNNRLSQIRRAVDGTAPRNIHAIGSRVVDSSIQQTIPYSEVGTKRLLANTVYETSAISSISYGLQLTANITANIGDIITQIDTDNSVVSTMRVLETAANVKSIAVIVLDGAIKNLPDTFDQAEFSLGDSSSVFSANIWPQPTPVRIASSTQPTQRPRPIIPTWTANTTFPVGSTVYYSGNTYVVVGNVYGSSFSNVTSNFGKITQVFDWSGNVADPVTNTIGNVRNSAIATLANVAVGSIISNGDRPVWAPNVVTQIGTTISYEGNVYLTTGNTYSTNFANISSNVSLLGTVSQLGTAVFYATTGNVFDAGGTFANISSNVIPYMSNVFYNFAGSSTTAEPYDYSTGTGFVSNLQLYDQWWNTVNSTLYEWDGTAWEVSTIVNPGLGFDNSTSPIIINGVPTASYIRNSLILGKVRPDGTFTITTGNSVDLGNLWYNPGFGTATDGSGLINSTTAAATFLKESRSFNATPGQTP